MATLLIVEDDKQTNEAICEYLKSAGHKLIPAYDGAAALELCEPYQLIAAAHQVQFSLDLPDQFTVTIPVGPFSKAVSNILANAVAYTETGKTVSVYMDERSLMIENECVPVPVSEIRRLFEPFYRPDFSRSRENGGNGLGLYIVDALLTSMNISYSFAPMKSPPGMCFTIRL